jgi:CHRD domain
LLRTGFHLDLQETEMTLHTRSTAGLAAALALVFAAPAALAADNMVTVPFKAQNKSGETGTATLTADGNKTRVEIALSGAPATAQPAHVHDGSCANIDPKPKHPLTSVVNGKSTTTLDVPLAQLTGGNLAINVHKSAAELTTYVACGDIPKK